MDIELFTTLGLVSITMGGLLSAFRAHKPTRTMMWLVGYLVIVVGLIQWGLAMGLQESNLHVDDVVTALVLFNIGNALVIIGRLLKSQQANARIIVFAGGAVILVSLSLLTVKLHNHAQLWVVSWLPVLIMTTAVFALIGVYLSARFGQKQKTK